MSSPTVFIVDPDDEARSGSQGLMESIGLRVEAFAGHEAFLKNYSREQFGCLVLRLQLPGTTAIDFQSRLTEARIELPVIIIAEHDDVESAVEAMKNGAFDFLEQPVNEQRLLDCVQSALSQDRSRRQSKAYRQGLLERFETLTAREKEVMLRVVQGMPNRLIAEALTVSPKTVEVHRSKVMEKMQAGSLSELISVAVVIGILSEYVDDGI